MPALLHYRVQGKIIREIAGETIACTEIYKDFFHDNPIEARKAALAWYEDYLHVLLQAVGNPEQEGALPVYRRFVEPRDIAPDDEHHDRGIAVWLVVDNAAAIPARVVEGWRTSEPLMIHGIGQAADYGASYDQQVEALETELALYRHFGYDQQGMLEVVMYFHRGFWEMNILPEEQPICYEILATPLCWEGLDLPFWWDPVKAQKVHYHPVDEATLRVQFSRGEWEEQVFCPVDKFNIGKPLAAKALLYTVAKAIAALLNTSGGELFIGVSPDGSVCGLPEAVIALFGSSITRNMVKLNCERLAPWFPSFTAVVAALGFAMPVLDGEEFIAIRVSPAEVGPVWLKGSEGLEFYIRQGSETIRLQEPEAIENWCRERWG